MAPGTVQREDAIVIFKGIGVLFLIGKSSEREGRWRLVGECYVHGILNGEGKTIADLREILVKLF